MTWRHRPGHLILTLRSGEAFRHVPAHLDVLSGASRPTSRADGGSIESTLRARVGGFRLSGLYHARRNLGHVGARHLAFADDEEQLGMSRTYRVEVADPDGIDAAVAVLRDHPLVERAHVETLAAAPATATAVAAEATPTADEVAAPHELVRAREALSREEGDERVTVAVVDTGVALGHAEFQRKLLAGYDAVELGLGRIGADLTLVGDSHGRDFAPTDGTGHGSHVAGIIGAQGWALPKGTGGRSLILPIRVLAGARHGSTGEVSGVGALGDIDAGLKIAVDLGASVINMSFGTPASVIDPYAPSPHETIVRYAVEHDCVLVAASGNSGRREEYFPAAHPDVIAVGSVDLQRRRSGFTTYGPYLSLSAPGEDIISVGRRGYRRSTGTSHAAPFVAGAAALLRSRARRAGSPIHAADVARILQTTAAPADGDADQVGAGVLDMAAAIDRLDTELSIHRTQQGAFHG